MPRAGRDALLIVAAGPPRTALAEYGRKASAYAIVTSDPPSAFHLREMIGRDYPDIERIALVV